jgi:hypothetical protein
MRTPSTAHIMRWERAAASDDGSVSLMYRFLNPETHKVMFALTIHSALGLQSTTSLALAFSRVSIWHILE